MAETSERAELLERAAALAERENGAGGLLYVHPADNGPPTLVVMTIERLNRIYERLFKWDEDEDKVIPEGDEEWQHDHVEPGDDHRG